MSKNAPDPYVSDTSSPNYTPLHEYMKGNKWLLAGMIGDGGFGFNATMSTLIPTGKVTNKNVQVGDHVGLGNLSGIVTEVYLNGAEEDDERSVAAIEIICKSPYLPVSYKNNHADYGYETETTIKRTVTLLKEENFVDSIDEVFTIDGNTTASVTYLGSVVVYAKQTEDPSTWTKQAQQIKHFQDSQS